MIIPLRNRAGDVIAEAIVDDADFAALNAWRWCLNLCRRRRNGYAMRGARWADGSFRAVFMHRELMSPPTGLCVDHINGNKLDNRRANLRVCTKAQNNANQTAARRDSASGVRGVSRLACRQKWRAQISVDGRMRYLGLFVTIEEAAAAYRAAAVQFHGEFSGADA